MGHIQKIKLSEVCSLIAKPRYVLATTYTLSLAFFESVVFQYIGRSNLRSCLILCDAIGYDRALSEGAALQGAAQDYLVVPAPVSGCFHPKVWIIIGEAEAVVLVGSGNLTQAGFMTNAEFFDALHFSDQEPASPQLMSSIRGFISGLGRMWSPADSQHLLCVETLSRIAEELGSIPVTSDSHDSVSFFHSFDGPLIAQMPEVADARELYVASPFFGNSLGGINLFTQRYPNARLNIFPGVHGGTATDIPLEQLSSTHKKATVSRLSIPGKRKDAFAHLKIYGIANHSDPAWLCCTSANCTEAAWNGPNIEAGLLRSVPQSSLPAYFAANETPLPHETIKYESNGVSGGTLSIWASDSGSRMEIAVAENCIPRLPLHNVTVTVRSGSSLAPLKKPILFQDTQLAYIDWNAFPDWHRRKKMAVCLEIEGTDILGNIVRGRCFVENRLLLTADPIHRSAWRGALTLLDDEGSPELADIAALFTLARDLFDGTLLRIPKPSPSANDESGSKDDEKPPSIAVWPPQPDIGELQKKIGGTAVGQLQWFQRILQTLLQNDKSEEAPEHTANAGDLRDESEDSDTESFQPPEDSGLENIAWRVWEKARKDYNSLHARLFVLIPTSDNAQNIWPAAVFAFLSTMAVFRKVKRMVLGVDLGIDSETLCDDFMRVMLNERKQHDDYCCLKGDRYRSEKFPALADDLRIAFKVQLHYELSIVMLAVITDHKMRCHHNVAFIYGQKQAEQVLGKGVPIGESTMEACRRIWRRLLVDVERKATDEDFLTAFRNLHLPGSSTLPL